MKEEECSTLQREQFVRRPVLSEGRHVTGIERVVQLQGSVQTRSGGRESQKAGTRPEQGHSRRTVCYESW